MRRILYYIIVFVLLCFVIPIIFTKKIDKEVDEEVNENKENLILEEKQYDYKKYNIIKLLHTQTNQIEELPLDEYLYGVVASEMPANFEEEALKAQAIVARTYTIYNIENNNAKHENADICDDSKCCQAWISKEDRFSKWDNNKKEEYWNKILEAVDSTKGKIITYEGKVINAFFHSNSGGKTESTLNVWGGENYPYLQTVETAGENAYNQYSSEVILTKETFVDKIKENHSDFDINFDDENCIQILEHTEGDRVKKIKIGNLEFSGVEVRNIMGLKSANFNIDIEGDNIKFKVIGYGHGVRNEPDGC